MTFSPGPASFIRGPKSALPSNTRGGSRVPEWGPLGSVRGALSNERPYRDLGNAVANYPFESSHRFPDIQPNSCLGDYSRLSCGVEGAWAGRHQGQQGCGGGDHRQQRPQQDNQGTPQRPRVLRQDVRSAERDNRGFEGSADRL